MLIPVVAGDHGFGFLNRFEQGVSAQRSGNIHRLRIDKVQIGDAYEIENCPQVGFNKIQGVSEKYFTY